MKKVYALIAGLVLLVAGIYFFGKPQDNNQTNSSSPDTSANVAKEENETEDQSIPHLGILQTTSHPSLDQINQGIVDALGDRGYVDGETITIDQQNGQGDQGNFNTMSEIFIQDGADAVVGIATPAALALANATSDIPIIMGAVTDPENVGLVDSNEAPGGNVTGVSDMTPVAEQLELIRQLLPEAKSIGIMYSSSEDNSRIQGDLAESLASDYDFETVTMTVSSTNDVAQVTSQLISQVDAIWVPNDNIIASAYPTLIETADKANIPTFPAVDQMVAQGGVATRGLNQYGLGLATGQMVADILEGASPATTPVLRATDTDLIINFDKAAELGITIPDSLKDQAQDSKDLEGAN